MHVSLTDARRLGMQLLTLVGVPENHAALQMDLLLAAELCGRPSHGLLRLERVVDRIRNGVANPTTVGIARWRHSGFLSVDGRMGLGPVVAWSAVEQIRERARETGVAVAAISNNNHLGMLGWYVSRIASAGQIGIALCTSEALVHPWGGRRAMLGTNPIAIGVPAHPDPMVLDMATGIVSMGQIHDYARRGQTLPPNWALDAEGEPTTDPVAARAGAIAPFGGPKGAGLGLAFEVVVASLTATALGRDVVGTLDSHQVCSKGDVFIVVDDATVGAMIPSISSYLDAVRSCTTAAGAEAVRVPGDRARASRDERMRRGMPVPDDLWTRLNQLANEAVA